LSILILYIVPSSKHSKMPLICQDFQGLMRLF